MVQDCKSLISLFSNVSLSFIKRDCNRAADYMSKLAYSTHNIVWIEEGPMDLNPLLLLDSVSSSVI